VKELIIALFAVRFSLGIDHQQRDFVALSPSRLLTLLFFGSRMIN